MKRLLILLLLFAQTAIGQQSQWFLLSEWGGGLTTFRDLGTSPISYHGPDGSVRLGATREGELWTFSIYAEGMYTKMQSRLTRGFNFSKPGGMLRGEASALRQFGRWGLFDIEAGGSLVAMGDWRKNASLGNTMSMFTAMGCIVLSGRASLPLGRNLFFFQADMLPMAAFLRPGYGYNENFTAGTNTGELNLSGHEWIWKGVPGGSTEVGWQRTLKTGNRIGACYKWRYHTTGNQGCYRADFAEHILRVTIDFLIHESKQ